MFEFKIDDSGQQQAPSGGLYDLAIVGAGPAGLSAAIYASRDGIKTLVFDKSSAGGLAATTDWIENYPGFPEGISGPDLMDRMQKQAERFGAELLEFEEVTQIEPVSKGHLRVHTASAEVFDAKMVLLALGSHPKKLNVPGEEEYYGRGVSYCATCDGPLFRDKDVVIVGAGNSGLQEGLNVLNYARSVTFIEFLPYSIAEKILQERTMNHPKSTFYFNHMLTEIKGDAVVTGVVMKNRETGAVVELPCDGVFIYVGYTPDTRFLEGLVEMNKWGYIKTDAQMWTGVEGLMAIGDVRASNLAQVTVAVADGTKAAIAAREYLAELEV
ncbi:MAG: FAD-dependent oxidoreductase [Anaerolineae bacterium]|nr:FAD-dependent oxidoreductase [Anaerolineae bacterium]